MDNKLILSPKPERPRPPKLMCMHLTSIPTCINILSRFRSIKFFHDHGQKGKFSHVFEHSNISETGEATPTKIGVHALYINPYLHEFFELILINSIFMLQWMELQISYMYFKLQ